MTENTQQNDKVQAKELHTPADFDKGGLSQEVMHEMLKNAQASGGQLGDAHVQKGTAHEHLPSVALFGTDAPAKGQLAPSGDAPEKSEGPGKIYRDTPIVIDPIERNPTTPIGGGDEKFRDPGDIWKEHKPDIHDIPSDWFDRPVQIKDEGVQQLKTGDYMVNDNGKHTLFTPNGDHIAINADGTTEIKGNVQKVETDKDGTTTVTFADGSSASYDKNGFKSVNRDGRTVKFSNYDDQVKPYLPDPGFDPGIVPYPHHHLPIELDKQLN